MSQTPVPFWVDNAEHIPCHMKTKKKRKEKKNEIANCQCKCKWFFMATFATWLASSDLCFVPGARWHGPKTVNCKRDYELKWYEVMCTTSLLFGCCRVFGLGLFFWPALLALVQLTRGQDFAPLWWFDVHFCLFEDLDLDLDLDLNLDLDFALGLYDYDLDWSFGTCIETKFLTKWRTWTVWDLRLSIIHFWLI